MRKRLASVRKFVTSFLERMRQAITRPRDELDRWQKAARYLYDLGWTGVRQLSFDRAPQMAGALSFRTLFGLFPVMVVATVMVRALGMEQAWVIGPLQELLDAAGLTDVHIMPTNGGEQSDSLNAWLQDRFLEATQVNLTAIRWVGAAVTAYAAIGLIVTVENCFNTIYRVPRGRAWTRRVPLYWFMLTVSPLVLILGAYLNNRIADLMAGIEVWTWVSSTASLAWSLFVLWTVMTLVYLFLPNSNVAIRPALAGAFVAAVLLEVGKRSFGAYLENALSISQLYGSLGLIPLFMFWVYLMWLLVLFGLEVSAILQTVQGGRISLHGPHVAHAFVVEPTTVVLMMERVARDFERGHATSLDELLVDTSLPEPVVEEILELLVEAEFVHALAGDKPTVTLARPAGQLPAEEIIDIGFQMADRRSPMRSDLTDRLRQAQRNLVRDDTLASLVATENTG